MSDSQQPTYLVSACSDPVVVRVNGKANYLNCNNFKAFIEQVIAKGAGRILLDFKSCEGMDSTFLGILAGTALELRRKDPPGNLSLCCLGQRNRELIENLGLQNLLDICENSDAALNGTLDHLNDEEVRDRKTVLKAHESLSEAAAGNKTKFQDVIAFLRNQVESENQS